MLNSLAKPSLFAFQRLLVVASVIWKSKQNVVRYMGVIKMNQYIENIIQDAIFVPNSWLPEEFRNYKSGGRTLAELEKLCDKRDGKTKFKETKLEKAERIKLYAKQFEQEGKFDYVDIDGHSQYNHQMAFAKYCPAIDLEDENE